MICLSQCSASNDTQRHACLLQQPVCWPSDAQQRGISEKVNGMKNYREHPTSIWKTTEAAVKCEFHACTSIHVKGKRDEMDERANKGGCSWPWLTFVKPKRERGACTAKAAQLVPPAPRPFHPSSRRRNLFLSLLPLRLVWALSRPRFCFPQVKGDHAHAPPWGPVQY